MQRFLIFITVLGTLWLCACQKTEPEELRFQPSPSVPEAGTVPLQLSFGVVEQRTSIPTTHTTILYRKPEW